jgi:hypothetical protein
MRIHVAASMGASIVGPRWRTEDLHESGPIRLASAGWCRSRSGVPTLFLAAPTPTIVQPMPDLLDTVREAIDARLEELRPLAREARDLKRALDALDGVSAAPTADGRVRRRQPGQRGSPRPPRSARGDIRELVIEYVAANPGSTAGDVAKALGLNRNSVATRLTQLAKRGQLVKARRGYSAA